MKKLFLIALPILLITTGCKKERIPNSAEAPPPPPPAVVLNTAPEVTAGLDIQLVVPADSSILAGFAWDEESNIVSYSWKKISGPTAYSIETPDSIVTKVRNLQKGTYEFEFMATDKGNLRGKDTIVVSVIEAVLPGSKEKIFKDLQWSCPMGCSIVLPDFYTFIPPGTSFKVYIRKENSNAWIEVPHESHWTDSIKYVWVTYNQTFWVYSNDEDYNNKWEVKIIY